MTRRHKSTERFTPFQRIVAIWVAVAAAIVLALILTPRREPPPKPSTISFGDRPSDRAGRSRRGDAFRRGRSGSANSPGSTSGKEAEQDPFVIFGVVRAADSGKPIQDAYIRSLLVPAPEDGASDGDSKQEVEITPAMMDSARGLRRSTKSNEQGQYALPAPRPGKYVVQASRAGFLTRQEIVEIPEGAEKEQRLDITLSKGASITGRVTEAGNNKGIPLITLNANSDSGTNNAEGESNADGTYEISGLLPGTYQVSLDLTRQPYKAPGTIPVRNVVIETPDQTVKDVNFILSPAGTVWGYVTDTSKQPVQRTQVYLCTSESLISQALDAMVHRAPPLHSRSEEDGYYELIGVPLNQEWRVYADSDEHAPQLTDPFLLTEAARSARVDIHVMSGTSVYGRVIDQNGSPVARASALCVPSYSKLFQRMNEARAFRNCKTEDDGSFVIANLPPGDYQLLAQKEGYKIAVMGDPVYADGFNDIHGFDVVLSAVDSGNFVVYGIVTDTAGRPIPGVKLTLAGLGTESMSATELDTETDQLGEFGFYGVEAGFLVLTAHKEGYASKQVNEVKLDTPTSIIMEACGSVRGTVLVRETGRPPERYNLRAVPADSQEGGLGLALFSSGDMSNSRSFDKPDGSFELSLSAGAYTVEASAQGFTPGRQEITVAEGQRLEGVNLYVSQAGGAIEGQVRTTDGGVPAGATVWITAAGASQFGRLADMIAQTQRGGVQVGADGRFEFRNLADGTYTVYGQAEGYAQGNSGPVQIAQSRTVSGVVVSLGGGGRLQGYVTRNGAYLPGAIVTVIGNGISEMASADQNGQYVIDGLAAGSYMATAVSFEGRGTDLFSPMHAQVVIREGETTVHNFGEEGGATVQGLCTPAPTSGVLGFAIVRIPGSSSAMTGLNLTNPADWFSGQGADGAPSVIGMSPIRGDGFFQVENCPDGSYQLDIMYVNIGEAMAGTGRPRASLPVTIQNGETVELNISLPES
ncbi:MAG TPA: carboxypeptidase regulatory-like domain-containing protein [Candidatus Hydrogenedentes bacterium]|nr:carboxypeptidase regulatory-like domain-containing protein [Candidatus Hydrogenedentota bacterium]